MIRHHWIIMAFIGTGAACSSATLKKAPFLTANTLVEESTTASSSSDARPNEDLPDPVPMPTETKAPEENVSPPANISGAYLICSEMKAATAADPESLIHCGLRDEKTNNKVNIEAGYASKIWTYQASDNDNLVVSMVELPLSLEWHIAVTLKAPTLGDLQTQQDTIRFFVSVTNSAGVKFQASAPVTPTFVQWLALNGAQIPTPAAIGGTEDDGTENLYICRMAFGGESIPGKLEVHDRDSNKSNCFTTHNGTVITSQSENGDDVLAPSDVLVITQGVFDDYFEWIPSTNGLKPAQAYITGKDAVGNPLYTCRNLQADESIAEQTPGVLRPGASTCAHSYDGFQANTSYQVLAWKAGATQKIIDVQKAMPAP
ncbi:DUF3421 domain-containing protein [Oligoflexus tunisiensis]|uniref:DUF3421 domain-containing protein n=1 Tax=Oligoflexus tunisiensis TaxID=708132 RepID=UPI000A5A4ACA|nr:DUF3421 domain-containing protein [Oligoflexus tunisiensis]